MQATEIMSKESKQEKDKRTTWIVWSVIIVSAVAGGWFAGEFWFFMTPLLLVPVGSFIGILIGTVYEMFGLTPPWDK